MQENIYFSKKRRIQKVRPQKTIIYFNQANIVRKYKDHIIDQGDKTITALYGGKTLVFEMVKPNLYKVNQY